MKKKLTAVLLTLCMVLGMLPMSVFAKWAEGVTFSDITDSADYYDYKDYYKTYTSGGTVYLVSKADITRAEASQTDMDIPYYYYNNGSLSEQGKLSWTVTTTVAVTGVTLSPTTLNLKVGGTGTLTPTVAPEDATNKAVTWSSNNTDCATVSSEGIVTAVAAGTATITVTTKDGGKTATCTVTVEDDVDNNSYYVTVAPATNGKVTLVGVTDGKAKAGTTVTVNVTPNEGYKCTGVTVATANVTKVSDTQYTFIMPKSDVTVTANIEATTVTPTEYTITAKANPTQGGEVETTPSGKATKGTTVAVKATANTGYKFSGITVLTGETAVPTTVTTDTDSNTVYSFDMPASNVDVIATFIENTKKVDTEASTSTDDDGKTVATATPDTNTVKDAITGAKNDVTTDKVTINVTGADTADKVDVTVPKDALTDLTGENAPKLEIATPIGSVTIDADAVAAGEDVKVTLEKGSTQVEASDGTKVTVDTISVSTAGVQAGKTITLSFPRPSSATKGQKFYAVVAGKTVLLEEGTDANGNPTLVLKATPEDLKETEGTIRYMDEETAEKTGDLIKATSVTITGPTTVKVGASITLKAEVTPDTTTDPTVTWSSSDPSIATVDQNGKVTGVKAGDVTITATCGDVSDPHDVKVTANSGNTGSSGGGGGGGGGGAAVTHSVNTNPVRNGSLSVKPGNAAKGEKVTITLKPNEGYVLDTLTVKDANGKEVTLTKVNDTTYTFVMPETSVTVDAAYKAADGSTTEPTDTKFSDVTDSSYTFYDDIYWVAGKGFMSGYSDGTFRPTANTTRQALWMVLARMAGENPADMAAARVWAMNNNISDGTNPTNSMTRQQMVAMLYRYAQLKGYKTTGGTSYDTAPDAGSVADYAKDAVSWAVGNNILRGTSDGRLNPTGTASRANFAAFLHRFCETAGIA